jgi:hypothetical protein
MSLPLALSVRLPQLFGASGYLRADPGKASAWQQRLGTRQRPRIGLVWSGGFRAGQPEAWETNNRRNLPLHYLSALRDLPFDFISLQKGQPAESELAQALAHPDDFALPTIRIFTQDLHDFSDTAALISQLDLVISVDTSTAHLSAALGCPTWILNRFDACWRWLIHPQSSISRLDSPWYDSVRLYHPTTDGDWPAVIALLSQDLLQWADNAPHQPSSRNAT